VYLSPRYFDALKIPLRSGRLFREQEPARTVIINEAFGRPYWPNQNAVASVFIGAGLGPKSMGAVGDVRDRLEWDPPPTLNQMFSQIPDEALRLVTVQVSAGIIVRSKPGPAHEDAFRDCDASQRWSGCPVWLSKEPPESARIWQGGRLCARDRQADQIRLPPRRQPRAPPDSRASRAPSPGAWPGRPGLQNRFTSWACHPRWPRSSYPCCQFCETKGGASTASLLANALKLHP
jgi:hypothetical protein